MVIKIVPAFGIMSFGVIHPELYLGAFLKVPFSEMHPSTTQAVLLPLT
jgi:hypothetical protein